MSSPESDSAYLEFLHAVKASVHDARVRIAREALAEIVQLYWRIGKIIRERQQLHGWGAKVIDRLAVDLDVAFPGARGFSPRSLRYMRDLADAYPSEDFATLPFVRAPWGHVMLLLDRVQDASHRIWYAQEALNHGWSRAVLLNQINNELHLRRGQAIHNFERALPAPDSELVRDTLKDPYIWDFVRLHPGFDERRLEDAIVENIVRFMLDLGRGFYFAGRQHRLVVDGEEFFIDLLFYNHDFRRFFVIDLKIDEFKPEYVGKMGFYLAAVDDLLRRSGDEPSIGLILCASRNETIVRYTLRDTSAPMAVAQYVAALALPESVRDLLPTPGELRIVVDETKIEAVGETRNAISATSEPLTDGSYMEDQVIGTPLTEPE